MTVATSRTNGFLFADLRDYTRYVERHGDAAAAALLDVYRAVVRDEVGKFGGAEIKTEGDSFYVVFPSASAAVQCGLAILEAARDRSSEEGVPIRVGIGVHAGETVETSEGYVGSAVNVAARVCSQAKAGELLVTDTVRALTRTFLPVGFVDRRTRRLKGIAEPVTMYRVVAEGAPADRRSGPGADGLLSGVGRSVRIGVLLIGLLIGGAAAGYLLQAAQRPSGDGPGGGSPSPVPSATFPTSEEVDLVGSVPLPIRERSSCGRTPAADRRLGTVASVRCDLDVGEAADTAWYDSFETRSQLIFAFDDFRNRQGTRFGECSPTVSRAHGNWGTGSTLAGSVLCFQADGASWIIWTYTADRLLVRAVRAGTAAADWADLYEWWDRVKLFQH